MKLVFRAVLIGLNSWASVPVLILFCAVSFYLGELRHDMNLFAASGGVMTVFGLLSLIKVSTIEKYLNQERIIAHNTGVTGPPISDGERDKIIKRNQDAARVRMKAELGAEIKGLGLTVLGTFIWAYGVYVPVFHMS